MVYAPCPSESHQTILGRPKYGVIFSKFKNCHICLTAEEIADDCRISLEAAKERLELLADKGFLTKDVDNSFSLPS